MTDLSNLKPTKETIEVILKHPSTGETLMNDDGTEMSVTVYAPYTKKYRSAGFSLAQRRMKDGDKKDIMDFTFEELEVSGVELLAEVTVDWDITYDGKKPKFTKAKAKEVYEEIFWMKGQIEGVIGDSLDFTKL
jgi:hypothetical protein